LIFLGLLTLLYIFYNFYWGKNQFNGSQQFFETAEQPMETWDGLRVNWK